VLPAQQRLGAEQPAVLVDLRLIAEEKLPRLQRLPQIPLESGAARDR